MHIKSCDSCKYTTSKFFEPCVSCQSFSKWTCQDWLKEWLSSFNTDSAPICFNKIQDLKRECEKE